MTRFPVGILFVVGCLLECDCIPNTFCLYLLLRCVTCECVGYFHVHTQWKCDKHQNRLFFSRIENIMMNSFSLGHGSYYQLALSFSSYSIFRFLFVELESRIVLYQCWLLIRRRS